MSVITTISFDNLVQMHNQEVTTTSKIVADTFEKQHKHVLAKIDEIIAETPVEFNKPNFRPIEIEIDLGLNRTRKDRAYEITKDGFMLLVMGFTGKKAMEIKIKFIQAFNWAFEQLQKSTSKQREVLITACEKLAVGRMARPQAYALVANQFGYQNPVDIPVALIPEATAFAYEMILRLQTTEQPHAPLPPEQWQIGTMANTQSYRYLISIQNDINTINRRLKHMIDLNVQVNESFMAIG